MAKTRNTRECLQAYITNETIRYKRPFYLDVAALSSLLHVSPNKVMEETTNLFAARKIEVRVSPENDYMFLNDGRLRVLREITRAFSEGRDPPPSFRVYSVDVVSFGGRPVKPKQETPKKTKVLSLPAEVSRTIKTKNFTKREAFVFFEAYFSIWNKGCFVSESLNMRSLTITPEQVQLTLARLTGISTLEKAPGANLYYIKDAIDAFKRRGLKNGRPLKNLKTMVCWHRARSALKKHFTKERNYHV